MMHGFHLLLTLGLFLGLQASAAPLPATSSSLFLNPKKNYFLHPFKISLNLEKTPYSISLNQNQDDKWFVVQDQKKQLITLRLKRFQSDQEYERSLKTWMKDFQKSGLQLVAQEMGDRRPEKGWIHLRDSNGQQLLQYFRYQNLTWVYFNCVGPQEDLQALQKSCEELSLRIQFLTL
ncbi:MAG: hypothetical protein ACK5Y2_12270 [Bdellovibrionales bacterium]